MTSEGMSLREELAKKLAAMYGHSEETTSGLDLGGYMEDAEDILDAVTEEVERMPEIEDSELIKIAPWEGQRDYAFRVFNYAADIRRRVAKAERANIVTELRKEG